MNNNKLGPYITRLMATIIDKEEDEFVQQLAWSELNRLKIDINSFLQKNALDDKAPNETPEKTLLQEEK
jgi:hypothetical protein